MVLDVEQMRAVRSALTELGYEPRVEFMHFEKDTGRGPVKVDLLTGPITPPERAAEAKIKPPRVRPSEAVELHAYLTPEAIETDAGAMLLTVTGTMSDGQTASAEIRIAGAFTLMLMKLHAFRDRLEDERKGLSRHHALDLYRIVAMLDQDEFDRVQRVFEQRRTDVPVQSAVAIAGNYFGNDEGVGVLRLGGYVRDRLSAGTAIDVPAFVSGLHDLTGLPTSRP